MIPKNFKLTYNDQQIRQSVSRIGAEITKWAATVWQDSHTDVIAIPVLKGGLFFFSDLVRAVDASLEMAVAQSMAYVAGVNEAAIPQVKINISQVPAKGRRILLIDDICDSGRTLQALQEGLLAEGALEVRSAVLIKRAVQAKIFEPDWCAFEYPGDEWFVGYGMEDGHRYRNLPGVYIIQKS